MLTKGSERISVRIAAYEPGDAAQVFDAVKETLPHCSSLTASTDGGTSHVRLIMEPAPALGDDTLLLKSEVTEGGATAVIPGYPYRCWIGVGFT
ncbi:hypothetical protein NGB36_17340 [Streptomyces sp. RB6PN25]|uniref:Uncharacterized protein n=1 Tax=Streptomyces humicola TaxID=2953240 RepID=A0ABT1PXC2_9ACTN|nr:hypothetical protein [Streptomyces humicola]MCQ4082317.1 hypothetical protein [Streptomyces humicola]